MNKKILSILIFAFGLLSADEYYPNSVEFRIAGSYPASSRFRNIYGNFQTIYEIQANSFWGENTASWVNAGWLSKEGRSTGCTATKTRVQIASLSLGGNYIVPIDWIASQVYCGFGITFSEVSVKNSHETYARRFSPGLVFKCGLNIPLFQNMYANLFADYDWQANVFKTNVNVGSLRMGTGIGFYY